jgi:cystathionine gamma-lyase
MRPFGLSFTFVDTTDLRQVERAMRASTKVLWIESPTNPLLQVTDLKAAAEVAHAGVASCVVDNTFASPYFQQPLALGADVVLHSTTKYLAGHADVVGGALVVDDEARYARLKFLQNAVGATPGPLDCWLTLRGLKTLAYRMQAHERNATRVAMFLEAHPRVKRVYYPGLPSHPGHAVAMRQMSGYSGMVSFEVKGGIKEATRALGRMRVFKTAESLGGVESLVELPAIMTHASIPKKERVKAGLDDGLIRLSVGVEDGDDLLEDLRQSLLR